VPDGVKRDEDVDRGDIQDEFRTSSSRSGPRPALVMIVLPILATGLYFAYDHWQCAAEHDIPFRCQERQRQSWPFIRG